MALSREIWAAIEEEFARAIFWHHAWHNHAKAHGPHPLMQMDPAERERRNRRYDRIQNHFERARKRYLSAPRGPFLGG